MGMMPSHMRLRTTSRAGVERDERAWCQRHARRLPCRPHRAELCLRAKQEGQRQTKSEWGVVAYGTRHIAISYAQYKANGYKPTLKKLVTKSPSARISSRFGVKPRSAKGETFSVMGPPKRASKVVVRSSAAKASRPALSPHEEAASRQSVMKRPQLSGGAALERVWANREAVPRGPQ
jgi:hypothetical protein